MGKKVSDHGAKKRETASYEKDERICSAVVRRGMTKACFGCRARWGSTAYKRLKRSANHFGGSAPNPDPISSKLVLDR